MGALAEQTNEFGFGAGLSEKEDAWLSSSGFGTLHNCVQDKTGALEKWPGYTALKTAFRNGDINGTAPAGLLMDVPDTPVGHTSNFEIGPNPKLVKRGELVAAIANGLLLAQADQYTLQGRVSPWVCEQRTVYGVDGAHFECCASGDWSYTAFETAGNGINIAATYLPTGEVVSVFNVALGGVNSHPRIVAIDSAGTALVFFLGSIGGAGKYCVVTPGGIGVAQSIPSLATLPVGYDVVGDVATAQIWIVLLSSASLLTSNCYVYASGAISLHATVGQAVSNATACSLAVDVANNGLVLCWVEYLAAGGSNFTLAVRALSRTLDFSASLWTARSVWEEAAPATLGAGHIIYNLGVAKSPNDGWFFAFTTDGNNTNGIVGRWVSTTGVVQGAATTGGIGNISAPLMLLRSRPAWDGVRMFFLADGSIPGKPRRGHMVLGIEPRSTAGKAAPLPQRFGVLGAFSYLTAGATTPVTDLVSRPYQDPTGAWHLQSLELGGQGGTLQLLCDYALIADDRAGLFAELGKSTYISGAVLSQWDGVRVCEAGFHFDPTVYLSGVSPTGGLMAAGQYTYAITYGRMTATGELVRSRPSLTVPVTLVTSTGTVTLGAYVPGPSNLVDQDDDSIIFVEFWRSEVGTNSPLMFAGRVVVNLYSQTDISFTDLSATYAGAEQLYSDGVNGEIANTPPASPISICQWRSRLWMTDGEQIYYTKEAAATRGAEWSQAFFVVPRGTPDRLSAVAPLGETLIVLSEDRTFYIYGDGPAADGSGSTLIGPMPIISELGCTQPAGIAQLPDVLLVPTRRGLQFLNGQRQYSYAGAPIEDTLAEFPLVRCARHITGTNLVWICLANATLTAGVTAIYDTFHKTFSTLFATSDVSGQDLIGSSTIDVDGVHTWTASDGSTYQAAPGDFRLNQGNYSQVVETPWFKANGPSGELRIRRLLALMKREGTSAIRLDVGYDFTDAYQYSLTVADSGDPDFNLSTMEGEPNTLQLRIPFPRQRCQSYRLRFTELPPAGAPPPSSAGFRFVSLRMTTSLRPGTGKLLSQANMPAAFTKEF